MVSYSHPLPAVLLLGVLQGGIVGTLLYTAPGPLRLANRLLAVLLFLFALACLNMFGYESGLYGTSALVTWAMDLLPGVLIMPAGPLLYFYTRAVAEPDFKFTRRLKLHFLPVVLELAPDVLVWVFLFGLATGLMAWKDLRGWGDVIDAYQTYLDLPRWCAVTVYVVLARRFLGRHGGIAGREEDWQRRHLPWLGQFLRLFILFQGLWLLFLVPYLSPYRFDLLTQVSYYPVYLPLVALIYGLGLKGYLHTRLHGKGEAAPAQAGSTFSVPPATVEKTVAALRQAMEADKLYLDPELNLNKLVQHTGIEQKTISHVLNQHLGQSFNAFVNGYRIAEVKRRLRDPAVAHLTLTGIAFDCGFNSQATFQRTFKQATQMTPKAYLATVETGRQGQENGEMNCQI
jgi:AraC-like DNA-binding protein